MNIRKRQMNITTNRINANQWVIRIGGGFKHKGFYSKICYLEYYEPYKYPFEIYMKPRIKCRYSYNRTKIKAH
jgi:hypothetical protein